MKVGIIGAGKGGEIIAEYLKSQGYQDEFCNASYMFFDERKGNSIEDIPEDYKLIISSSNMEFRRRIFARFDRNRFININRSGKYQVMGVGNVIFPNVHFDYFCEIGDNNVISNGVIINHHCKVGNGNLFGPGCLLSGSVTIGNDCTIASGVIFEPNVKVGDRCSIASGSVIIGDLEPGTKVKAVMSNDVSIYQGGRVINLKY